MQSQRPRSKSKKKYCRLAEAQLETLPRKAYNCLTQQLSWLSAEKAAILYEHLISFTSLVKKGRRNCKSIRCQGTTPRKSDDRHDPPQDLSVAKPLPESNVRAAL